MYGKLPERKLKESDYLLSCEQARKELDEYLDTEDRRVNVDSAKKRAVVMHMDYEGFRQMVLGANIFPTKSAELTMFSQGQQNNGSLVQNKLFDEKKKQEPSQQTDYQIRGNSEKHCLNFRDFKKKLLKNYQKELTWEKADECYSLIKEQNQSRLEKIFGLDCEADILLKIVEIFRFVAQFIGKKEKNEEKEKEKEDKQGEKEQKQERRHEEGRIESGFMVKFLQTVLSIPTMQDISLNILTKKQRQRIALFLEDCKVTLTSEQEVSAISKVVSLIRKE